MMTAEEIAAAADEGAAHARAVLDPLPDLDPMPPPMKVFDIAVACGESPAEVKEHLNACRPEGWPILGHGTDSWGDLVDGFAAQAYIAASLARRIAL